MKTFIFGGTREQAESYKNRNFLFSAAMVRDCALPCGRGHVRGASCGDLSAQPTMGGCSG
jgi:hypothetical protein